MSDFYTDGFGNVFQEKRISQPISGIMLVDLNKSAKWKDGFNNPTGYTEGYLVEGQNLISCYFDFGYSKKSNEVKYTKRDVSRLPCLNLNDLKPCGVKKVTIRLGE